MRPSFLAIALVVLLASRASGAPAGIESFQPWIGTWDTEDTYHPEAGDPSIERGVRTCRLVLRDRYLQCETAAINARGVERTYWFLINHNAVAGRFEMLSVWSNVPFKAVHQMTPAESGRVWRITGLMMIGDSDENLHHSVLAFDGPDRIVWTGRRLRAGLAPEDAPISFVETWRRRVD